MPYRLVVLMKGNGKSRALVSSTCLLLIAISAISFSLSIASTSQADGTGDYPPPPQQDWIIKTNTIVRNETLTVSGNITIESGGTLTLENTILIINASDYGNALISVKNGGTLNIIENSKLMEGYTGVNYDFVFENDSHGLISKSTIEDCGWNDGETYQSTGGILIWSDDVIIENSTIQNNFYGIVIISSSPTIRYNNIQDNLKYGIFIINSSADITGNTISTNPVGIHLYYSEITLTDNEIRDNGDGGRLYFSDIQISGGEVSSNSPDDCSTGSCSAQESGKGLYVSSSNLSINGVTFSENNGGLISSSSLLDIRNSIFSRNNDDGILGEYSEITLKDNIFTDNENYGIHWKYTDLEVDDTNSFILNNGEGRVILEWEVGVTVSDSYGNGVSIATVTLDNGNNTFSTSRFTDPLGSAYLDAPEFEISNDGTYIHHNPYTATAKKTAPWDGVEYSNSTVAEIINNTFIDITIPLVKPDLRVDSIKFSQEPKAGKKVQIKVEISNIGDAGANDAQVMVTQKDANGQTAVINTTWVSVPSNQNTQVTISWTPKLEGETTVTVVINTLYDEIDKDNNELEKIVDVKKDVAFYEEPYFVASLGAVILILAGVSGYVLALRKNKKEE